MLERQVRRIAAFGVGMKSRLQRNASLPRVVRT
jgi:hypothetical protein